MITTYTVSIQPNRILLTDKAISLFLWNNPIADVEDALDEIFQLGIDAMIARCEPENLTPKLHEISDIAYGNACL